ncbi:hypothetical protein AOY87_10150 [Escherichia coli]|nr:hypothetical protein AOY87_10150 [Escherichia coli]
MSKTPPLEHLIPGRYTVQAPYKAGVGICTPELHTAINDAPASFLSSTLTHIRIMVGWAGEPKGSPVSVCAGSANPVQSATSEICTSGGGSYSLHTEAAIMATVPTHSFLKIETVNGKAVTTSLFEYLKLLRLAGVPGYISRVAVNPATGFDSLKHINAHNRARGFFVCNARSRLNYGGLSGGAERLAGFVGVRSVNPAQVTTSCLTAARGDSPKLTNGAVDMTTTTTHPHLKIEVVNGKAVIFSFHVACHFRRMHQNIVDRIEYLNCSREFFTRNFIPGTYHIYGDSLRGYYITLEGLMMLQLGSTLRTMRYYESCIEAFHEAETSLNHSAFSRNQWEVRP